MNSNQIHIKFFFFENVLIVNIQKYDTRDREMYNGTVT